MSSAFLPRGTQFDRSPDGATYTKVGEAKAIGFSIKGNFEDVSNMDSPSAYKEWLAAMIDGGSVKVDTNFLNGDPVQNLLLGDLGAQTLLFWRVQLPNTKGKFEFQGFVEDFSPQFDVSKAASNSVSIKVSGAVVWTPNV